MELIAAAHVDSPFSFEFPATASTRDSCCEARSRDAGLWRARRYSPTSTGRSWQVARIGLSGSNGASKSTLLRRDRRRAQAPRAANAWPRQGLSIGYFAQHQVDAASPRPKRAVASCSRSSRRTRAGVSRLSPAATISAATGSARRSRRFSGGERRLTLRAAGAAAAEPAAARRADQSSRTSTCAKR